MGESLLESPKVENKMGESVTNLSCFQQSVSFGRFERDSLCWERWSTFPTNKYLEEVEKCSTPGSVAQKKAYFEAHYKKIAARRAELLLDQEREREAELAEFENSTSVSLLHNVSEEDLDIEKTEIDNRVSETGSREDEGSVEHVHIESNNIPDMLYQGDEIDSFDDEVNVEHVQVKIDVNDVSDLSNVTIESYKDVDEYEDVDKTIDEVSEDVKIEVVKDICEVNEIVKSELTEHFDKPVVEADLIEGNSNKWSQKEFVRADMCITAENPELGKLKESATVTEDVPSVLKSKGEGLPREKVKRTVVEEESRNLMNITKKSPLVNKTVSPVNTKKQPPTPVPKRTNAPMLKSSTLSTPKSSKTELNIRGAKSSSRLLEKKENGFTPSIKKTTEPRIRRVAPTSLHMSLSLGPMNSDRGMLSMRKSLIMESMGDKDIVKRAFKSFQKTPQQPSPSPNPSVSRKIEQKGSPANTLLNKSERISRSTKAANTPTEQGIRKTLLFPKVSKNGGTDQKNVKSVAASFGPRVLLQGSNRNEVSKKLDLKAKTEFFGKTAHMSPIHKVEKAPQIRRQSDSFSSKPKLLSSSYGHNGHKLGGSLRMEDGKTRF